MFKKAFTLAEVLITLAIIGIVAAVTIPSVIANYQQQEFKTGLRKAVSVLNEAIQANIVLEGETPYETEYLPTYIKRHMNLLSNAAANDLYQSNEYGYIITNSYFYSVDGMRFEITSRSNLSLHETKVNLYPRRCSSGCIQSYSSNSYCGSYGLSNNPSKTVSPPCVVLVDINGDKKPNPHKRKEEYWANGNIKYSAPEKYLYPSPNDKRVTDVFNILITEDRAIPYGVVAQRAMYEK